MTIPLAGHAGLTLKDLIDQFSGNQADNAGLLLRSDDEEASLGWFASSEVLFGEAPKLTIDYSAGVRVGDANLDGLVNDADLSLLLAHWGQDVTDEPDGGWGKGEFDGTAPVQDADLSLLLANWTGAGAAVPEPASALVLLLGFAGAALRRSKT